MTLAVRLIVTVCLFFSVWLCVYGYQASEAVEPAAARAFVVAFGVGSAAWIVYAIVAAGRARRR